MTLQDCVREFGDTAVALVTAHGDFSPPNLFLGDDRAVGFDFKATKARPAARDIMHFLVFAKAFNTPTWRLVSSQVDRHDLEAFLGGYGALDDTMDARLLMVFRLAEALRSWSHLLVRARREGRTLRRMARIRRLRSMAVHAARSLRLG
jgi:Ser/Thr protein kinase RdoA (MazF antagonist)